jgi:hypothetical protein
MNYVLSDQTDADIGWPDLNPAGLMSVKCHITACNAEGNPRSHSSGAVVQIARMGQMIGGEAGFLALTRQAQHSR